MAMKAMLFYLFERNAATLGMVEPSHPLLQNDSM